MFDSLSDKLQDVFNRLGRKGKLTEQDVDEALREVRVALLEADVNFKVVRQFISAIREKAVGSEVLESLTPAQQVVKIVHDQLQEMLGGASVGLATAPASPSVIMLVGLQGSGKTTTSAKLGLMLKKQGKKPLLVAADPYRPAAVEQLEILAGQLDLPIISDLKKRPPDLAQVAVSQAKSQGLSHVIVDTAGRLHVDDAMMSEVAEIKRRLTPDDVLFVADAMTGQDAVNAASAFNDSVGVTGAVLTKLDGDARGGAALSLRAVTGVPIKFIGVSERPDGLEPFHPDRMASRILGMGDVLTLIERAQETVDAGRAEELEKKFRTNTFDLNDFLNQLQQVRQMGPLDQILGMIPGLSKAMRGAEMPAIEDKQVKRVEAIILSMTPAERSRPEIIGGSRKRRIARGSGTTPADINQLLNQFRQMQKMMKAISSGRMPAGLGGMIPGIRR
ncbi:MAG TPA: signal recognition particle protein [Chloroflexota bacterium]|nr:signal recognition particle protein [Chloroflexota bacterium]